VDKVYEKSRKRLKASLKKQGLPMPLVCYRETCGHMYWPERMCNRRMVDQCSFRLLKPNAPRQDRSEATYPARGCSPSGSGGEA
jgi:hypothetical protein